MFLCLCERLVMCACLCKWYLCVLIFVSGCVSMDFCECVYVCILVSVCIYLCMTVLVYIVARSMCVYVPATLCICVYVFEHVCMPDW